MTEKELRKLNRYQLLELLVMQTERVEKLQKQLGKKPVAMVILWSAAALMLAVNIFSCKLSSILLMVAGGLVGLAVQAFRKAGGKA